jgi:uncharacterized protein YegJ (DUF2314 family)
MPRLARHWLLMLLSFAVFHQSLWSQTSSQADRDKLSPRPENAPKDKPVTSSHDQVMTFEDAIAPYVARARATLPDVKKRFAKGLNKGEVLFVTIRLYGPDKKYEQVFVEVKSWKGQTINGLLSTAPELVKSHHQGEKLVVDEKDVYDWTISKPDGTEEGNFVGNFLDTYHP